MFLGHGLVAFALVAAAARMAGWSSDRVVAVGLLAGGFALAPDVDILYAPVGVSGATSLLGAADGFWTASTMVHRTVTHSLLVGTVAAVVATLWTSVSRAGRAVALGLCVALLGLATMEGWLATLVMAGFLLAVVGLAMIGRRMAIPGPVIGAAAAVGLWTHPFGDLVTGQPPAMLYPLDVTLVADRLVLHPDPTMHLLAALGLELAAAWLALAVLAWVRGFRLTAHLTPRASGGMAFGGAAFIVPPPTLEMSYHFVFPLLGLSLACALSGRPATWRALLAGDGRNWLAAAVTGLAALTVAAVTYAIIYPVR